METMVVEFVVVRACQSCASNRSSEEKTLSLFLSVSLFAWNALFKSVSCVFPSLNSFRWNTLGERAEETAHGVGSSAGESSKNGGEGEETAGGEGRENSDEGETCRTEEGGDGTDRTDQKACGGHGANGYGFAGFAELLFHRFRVSPTLNLSSFVSQITDHCQN